VGQVIHFSGLAAEVERKEIRNVHLSVYPPNGRIRIAAPLHMSLPTIRAFAITKLGWIRSQQRQIQEQEREPPREFLEKESHFVWGKRYLMRVVEVQRHACIEFSRSKLTLKKLPRWDSSRCEALLEEWYRAQVRKQAAPLISRWENRMNVTVEKLFVQRMKTRWGSCTPSRGYIRLNTELAKKPRECLEYLIVHEMAHLIEPTHNDRFISLMDSFLPNWPVLREKLNRLPVKHEDWRY